MAVRFGPARHGWLPATLEIGGNVLAFDVSHLPYDFVAELTEALSGVLSAPGEYTARMCEEPSLHDWRFRSSDLTTVTFEVVSYRRGVRMEREAVVAAEVQGAPLDIVRPLWCALHELGGRAETEAFQSHWSHPFPFETLDRLTERVEHAKAATG